MATQNNPEYVWNQKQYYWSVLNWNVEDELHCSISNVSSLHGGEKACWAKTAVDFFTVKRWDWTWIKMNWFFPENLLIFYMVISSLTSSLLLCGKIHICVTWRGFLAQFIIMYLYILWQISSNGARGFYVLFNSSFACLSENIPSCKVNDNHL